LSGGGAGYSNLCVERPFFAVYGLAKTNPEAYLPDVAATLNNLANLYRATQRKKEAEECCREAERAVVLSSAATSAWKLNRVMNAETFRG
jgi:hypothetical protein